MAKAPDTSPSKRVATPQQPEFYTGKTLYPFIIALIALSGLFGLFVMPRLAPQGGRLLEKPAPDFTLPIAANGAEGGRLQLSEQRGRIVILDFWATWCGPCEAQAPILDRVARKHPEDVLVLGINVGEAPALARRFARAKGLSYPILADVESRAQALYNATSLPTLVFIDRDGKIGGFVSGLARQQEIERIITNLKR